MTSSSAIVLNRYLYVSLNLVAALTVGILLLYFVLSFRFCILLSLITPSWRPRLLSCCWQLFLPSLRVVAFRPFVLIKVSTRHQGEHRFLGLFSNPQFKHKCGIFPLTSSKQKGDYDWAFFHISWPDPPWRFNRPMPEPFPATQNTKCKMLFSAKVGQEIRPMNKLSHKRIENLSIHGKEG